MKTIQMCFLHYNFVLVLFFMFHISYSEIDVKVIIKRCNDDVSQPEDMFFKDRKSDEPVIGDDEHFPGIVRRGLDLEREFEMDEPEYPFHLTRCQRKLIISLWIKNRVKNDNSTDDDEQIMYIDHGYDDVTSRIVKLLSPVAIRFTQQPVLQAYPFRHIHVVNGQLREEVINKDETAGFTGCDDTSSVHPTCSYAYKKGKPIPYSQGFCCYCTATGMAPARLLAKQAEGRHHVQDTSAQAAHTTLQTREYIVGEQLVPHTTEKMLKTSHINNNKTTQSVVINKHVTGVPDIHKTSNDKQFHYEDTDNVGAGKLFRRSLQQHMVTSNNKKILYSGVPANDLFKFENTYNVDDISSELLSRRRRYSSTRERRPMRQSLTIQPRGGQDCSLNTRTDVDPDKFLSSAHCLRLHDVWYTVNAVQMPRLRHSVQLQVYSKKELPDGSQRWSDLNSGKLISLGTDSMHYMENNQTLVATYSGKVLRRESQVISNVTNKMLLIPQMWSGDKIKIDYPQLRGPGEYLLVSRSLVDLSGKSCNKIGATFSTFALQKDRCEKPRGTCLSNQPIQLWERDVRSGGTSRYRLAGFGEPHSDAVEVNRATGENLLLMKHTNSYTGYVDVEVDADSIGILRSGLHAQISNVYAMSGERITLVTVVVTNSGLVSSVFSVQIASCSHKVPDSRQVLFNIAPQNQMSVNITLSHGSEIIKDKIVCSTLVRNSDHKVVAARRIHAYPHDRCVCVWFCLCACTAERYTCTPMSLSHFRSSGFIGIIPSLNKSRLPYIAEIVLDIELVLLTLSILGLMLGCIKAVCGIIFPDSIGLFGLSMCNDKPRKIDHYYEHELRHFPVEYDKHGYPLHPLTKTPSVRRMSATLQFCFNLVWFFNMPLSLWYWMRTQRGCPSDTCSALCCCPKPLDDSPPSLGARQSLLSTDSVIPSVASEHRAQSYGGTSAGDLAQDRYRQSRDELRAASSASLTSSGSRARARSSANSLSRSTLGGSSAGRLSPTRRSSSARSVTSSASVGSAGSPGSPVRSSASLGLTLSGRRLSQMQGAPAQ